MCHLLSLPVEILKQIFDKDQIIADKNANLYRNLTKTCKFLKTFAHKYLKRDLQILFYKGRIENWLDHKKLVANPFFALSTEHYSTSLMAPKYGLDQYTTLGWVEYAREFLKTMRWEKERKKFTIQVEKGTCIVSGIERNVGFQRIGSQILLSDVSLQKTIWTTSEVSHFDYCVSVARYYSVGSTDYILFDKTGDRLTIITSKSVWG